MAALQMIYLTDFPHDGTTMKEIKAWLCGLVHAEDFLRTREPPIPDAELTEALRLAILELILNIDTDMETLWGEAAQPCFGIQVDEERFWAERPLDTENLRCREHRVRLDREATLRGLEMARAEIAWMEREHNRLRLHMAIAREQINSGWRTSFVYRALPRGGG